MVYDLYDNYCVESAMNYENIKTRIPALIAELNKISTEYGYERKYIGEANAYLTLLLDILKEKDERTN